MVLAEIYQLEWAGCWSDACWAGECMFLLGMVAVSLRYIIKAKGKAAHVPGGKGVFGQALRPLISMLLLILGGVASAGRPFLEGANQASVRNQRPNPNMLLACAILIIPLVLAICARCTFFEWPLAVSVTPQRVALIYRLLWRNEGIEFNTISNVELECKDIRESGGFKAKQYAILLEHNGMMTRIGCGGTYETQLKGAFSAIRSHLRPKIPTSQ